MRMRRGNERRRSEWQRQQNTKRQTGSATVRWGKDTAFLGSAFGVLFVCIRASYSVHLVFWPNLIFRGIVFIKLLDWICNSHQVWIASGMLLGRQHMPRSMWSKHSRTYGCKLKEGLWMVLSDLYVVLQPVRHDTCCTRVGTICFASYFCWIYIYRLWWTGWSQKVPLRNVQQSMYTHIKQQNKHQSQRQDTANK